METQIDPVCTAMRKQRQLAVLTFAALEKLVIQTNLSQRGLKFSCILSDL